MILKRFKVTNFRSVMNSGWIDCDNVISLVGINESGKSNIILALWKLNPAREGEIDLLHDIPVQVYSSWRDKPEQIIFIAAEFELDDGLTSQIAEKCNCDPSIVSHVVISRYYDGNYGISFPNLTVSSTDIGRIAEIAKEKAAGDDEGSIMLNGICDAIIELTVDKTSLTKSECDTIAKLLGTGTHKGKAISEYSKLKSDISQAISVFGDANPSSSKEIHELIIAELPKFVYYSNYGNLDAQIYLPHVVKLLDGEKVPGFDNQAKVRTLRVLFDFVNLKPQEMLDLGQDPAKHFIAPYGVETVKQPTAEEIAEVAKRKEERTILLQSASAKLTCEFKNWWKQGNYTFRLQADGDFFKVWVSDDKRPNEIELERRSAGLQWFLSFFLVFLVESGEAHKDAILLLDEAGLTLHPMAQKDLVAFFENLSNTNQIIHTTHSPFLVDTSNIDRVKVVYADKDGQTVASSDLRAADDNVNAKSIYAVHAALGLSVSDILLQGCQPVIVEGPSDQYYLNAIKLYLVKTQKFTPNMELVFVPTGGIKGVRGVVSILSGKNDVLPFVILDSDKSGRETKQQLKSNLYSGSKELLLDVGEFVGFENSEVEDLFPIELLSKQIDRLLRDVEDENFKDVYDASKPIVPQIEAFAQKNSIALEKGWKVTLAKSVKQQMSNPKVTAPDASVEKWAKLFNKINQHKDSL